jgi:hypothetical protein
LKSLQEYEFKIFKEIANGKFIYFIGNGLKENLEDKFKDLIAREEARWVSKKKQ